MSDDGENLGRSIPWQIRDVPQGIRDAVVKQARVEGVKVPELLTRLVLDARTIGWSFKASSAFANPSNKPDPAASPSADLAQLDLAATVLSKVNGDTSRAAGSIRARVAEIMTVGRKEKRRLLLAAPSRPQTEG